MKAIRQPTRMSPQRGFIVRVLIFTGAMLATDTCFAALITWSGRSSVGSLIDGGETFAPVAVEGDPVEIDVTVDEFDVGTRYPFSTEFESNAFHGRLGQFELNPANAKAIIRISNFLGDQTIYVGIYHVGDPLFIVPGVSFLAIAFELFFSDPDDVVVGPHLPTALPASFDSAFDMDFESLRHPFGAVGFPEPRTFAVTTVPLPPAFGMLVSGLSAAFCWSSLERRTGRQKLCDSEKST